MSINMEEHKELKLFINAVVEYCRFNTESSFTAIQRYLQIMASTNDSALFDLRTSTVTEFYVSLYELLTKIDSRSSVLWPAVSVLHKSCSVTKTKIALTHTFKFIPILSRHLAAQHTTDKQLRLLHVLEELTYGVKILWQEAHLPDLISLLVQYVLNNDQELAPTALEVLVNLCYKNLPALYVLMRKTDVQKFLKCITKLYSNFSSRVTVFKMLFVLEEVKGYLSEQEILNFLDLTFNTILSAYQTKSVNLLKHICDFFKDLSLSAHHKPIILKYTKLVNDSKKLLELIEDKESVRCESYACVEILFEFLSTLVLLPCEGLIKLFPTLTTVAINWLDNTSPNISIKACDVLVVVFEQTKFRAPQDMKNIVIEILKTGLPSLTMILKTDDVVNLNDAKKEMITKVMLLLSEMSVQGELRHEILSNVHYNHVACLFEEFANNKSFNVFDVGVSETLIQMLIFVSILASYSCEWMTLYTELLNRRYIHITLAVGLYSGDKKLKSDVFNLTKTPGWTVGNVSMLCDVMSEIRSITPTEPPAHCHNLHTTASTPQCQFTQEKRLDELLNHMQQAIEENKITDVSTSAVIEMYQFKLAAASHSDTQMQCSLEASDASCRSLSHQIAQYRTETSRLHEMLLFNQQCVEGLSSEKKDLMAKLQESRSTLAHETKLHSGLMLQKLNECNELSNQVQTKISMIEELSSSLHEVNNKLHDIETQLTMSQESNKNLEGLLGAVQIKENELNKLNGELEEKLKQEKSVASECRSKMKEMEVQYKESKETLEESIQRKDEVLKENEKFMTGMKKKIEELEKIREIVINVARGNKDLL